MYNHIGIMGRLTRDPELRRTQSGKAVCTITLAVDRDRQSKDGEKQTDFIDVVAWGKLSEFVTKYLAKGRMVTVEGRLQSRKWVDDSGNKRTSWEINAKNIYFADSRRTTQEGTPEPDGFSEAEEDGEEPS